MRLANGSVLPRLYESPREFARSQQTTVQEARDEYELYLREKGNKPRSARDTIDEAMWIGKAVELAGSGDMGAVAAMTAPVMGMRANEIVSRAVRDLDDGGTLLWIRDSKTEAGRRTLRVPELLQPYLLRLAADKKPDDRLFGHHWRDWAALDPGSGERRVCSDRGGFTRPRLEQHHHPELRQAGGGGGGPATAGPARAQGREGRLLNGSDLETIHPRIASNALPPEKTEAISWS
jgi:hypothetical protein